MNCSPKMFEHFFFLKQCITNLFFGSKKKYPALKIVRTKALSVITLSLEQITEEVQIEHSKEALNENITETFINEQKEDNSSKFNRVVEDVKDSQDSQNSNNGNIL